MVGEVTVAVMAFNLLCTGTSAHYEMQKGLQQKTGEQPFTVMLRVDLNAMRWCSEGCKIAEQVHAITDTRLLLSNTGNELHEMHLLSSLRYVDRETGRYFSRVKITSLIWVDTATCVRLPFTGLPPKVF